MNFTVNRIEGNNGYIYLEGTAPILYYVPIIDENVPQTQTLISLREFRLKVWQEIINAGAIVTEYKISSQNPSSSVHYTYFYRVMYKGRIICTGSPSALMELVIELDLVSGLRKEHRETNPFDSALEIFEKIGSPQKIEELQKEEYDLFTLSNRSNSKEDFTIFDNLLDRWNDAKSL